MRGDVHTNGSESLGAMLEWAHKGRYHKHLNRQVQEFVGRHNLRDLDTLGQMAAVLERLAESGSVART